MKDKTPQEQTAASRQVELITNALKGASQDGHWFNVAGRMTPRLHGKGAALSPFNALILGLHADTNGYTTGIYTSFQDARKNNDAVLRYEKAVPMNWYRWATYVNRANDKDVIKREQYLALPPEQQASYKAVRQREIRSLFNLEQTTFPHSDAKGFEALCQQYGGITIRGNIVGEEKQARTIVSGFRDAISQNLVPVRRSSTGEAVYDPSKDAIYMPDQKQFPEYRDYVQELMRQAVAATGHRERLSREGLVMPNGHEPSEAAARHETLIRELASAVKMMELGMPAKLSPKSMEMVEQWCDDLRQNPCMIDAVESDLNNALDVIRKAEQGERLESASKRNDRQTQEIRDSNRPQVSHAEALVLQDILAHGGMEIDARNFPGDENEQQAAKKEFMEKFANLDYYDGQLLLARYNAERFTKNPDPEHPDLANVAYTAASGEAARIYEKCSEWLPKEWEQKGSHYIADEMVKIPDKRNREFMVVFDKETGIADVVLPSAARSGGDVVMPNSDKRNFWLTPDEVMLPDERKEAGARVVSHNIPGFYKDKITAALMAQGATYVRFYNVDGVLQYRPDDAYFKNKDVYAAKLNGKNIDVTTRFDLSDAVSRATEKQFERVQLIKDDNGRWALFLKPENEASFSIYPEKDDVNRFFTALKQYDQPAVAEIRNELAQKYYAMATADPALKTDLFGQMPEGIDPQQIQRVNIFRSKDDKFMIVVQLAGKEKVAPREISNAQWQRLWVAEDVAEYKTALAANVFKDVLTQQTQRDQETHQAQEAVVDTQHNEEKGKVRPEEAFTDAHLHQFQQMKEKHPDAIMLFRRGDDYFVYDKDSVEAAKVFNTTPGQRPTEDGKKMVDVLCFDHRQLDTMLPKLVRAGHRVAICEDLEAGLKKGERVERGTNVEQPTPKESEKEPQRTGMRM